MKKPYVVLFISIVSVSFASIFILLCDAPPLSIAFYRLFFTTLLVLPLLLLRQKTRHELRQLPKSSWLIMAIIGLILAAHFALWITSLTKTSVASSVILVTAHPIIVAPISYVFLREKLSPLNAFGVSLSVAGVIILVFGNYGFSGLALDTFEGNVLAWSGGVCAGLYILGGRFLRKSISIFTYAFIVYAIGTVALFGIGLAFQAPVFGLRMQDYGIILVMALVSGVFGHTLYNWSLGYIRASVASVALLGEPIGSSLLAFVIFGAAQQPSLFTILGGAIILIGVYLTARTMRKTDLLENV